MLNPCFYYYFTKLSEKKVLTATPKEIGKGFDLSMEDQKDDPSQLWMVKSADLEDVFFILHCRSGLCLQATRDRSMHLHHLRDKDNQKFKFSKISIQNLQFQISEYSKDACLFARGNKVLCDAKTELETVVWKLNRVKENAFLQSSGLMESENSGYVLDVDDNAEKEGALLFQTSWSGTFSQRWRFEKFKDFYLIRNIKSERVMTVKGKKSKDGSEIIQDVELDSNHRHQLWSFEERGYHVYLIRLASQQDLFLGVDDFAKEKSGVILIRDSYKHLWRIVGSSDL